MTKWARIAEDLCYSTETISALNRAGIKKDEAEHILCSARQKGIRKDEEKATRRFLYNHEHARLVVPMFLITKGERVRIYEH